MDGSRWRSRNWHSWQRCFCAHFRIPQPIDRFRHSSRSNVSEVLLTESERMRLIVLWLLLKLNCLRTTIIFIFPSLPIPRSCWQSVFLCEREQGVFQSVDSCRIFMTLIKLHVNSIRVKKMRFQILYLHYDDCKNIDIRNIFCKNTAKCWSKR